MIHILFIMVGGGIGAVIRAWLTDVFKSKITSPIPIATLIVNLVGSFLIGFVFGIAQDYQLFSLFYNWRPWRINNLFNFCLMNSSNLFRQVLNLFNF